jgi:hypothetical protein
MTEQASRYQRSFGGMVGAMLVLVLVVLAFVVFRDLNRNDPPDPVHAEDWRTPLRFAREDAPFRVLAPERLPTGWIATSVRYQEGRRPSWHLGMLTKDQHYVGLEQAVRPVDGMVAEFVDEQAAPGDDVDVDGATWQSWSDEGGDHALTRRADGVTTLVVGTVPADDLAGFVATLS